LQGQRATHTIVYRFKTRTWLSQTKSQFTKNCSDLTDEQLVDIIDIIADTKIAGVIATNTTISREGIQSVNKSEMGGLSGKPLTKRSTEVIRFLSEKNKAFQLLGRVFAAEDAIEN
jgi:dihydroorotate dehydrogenase